MVGGLSPGGLGASLRDARERRGVTLFQIAQTTKISIAVLEALERNDISRLPGGIFSRGFVRSFAAEVGLDPEAAVHEFAAQFPLHSALARSVGSERVEDYDALGSDRQTAANFFQLLAISIPLIGITLYFASAGKPSGPTGATPAKPGAPEPSVMTRSEERLPPSGTAPSVPTIAPNSGGTSSMVGTVGAIASSNQTAGDRLLVMLTTTRPCWVSATVDGRKEIERLLHEGEQRSLDVRGTLLLTVGDAGAITMRLNGLEARPLGRDGEVVTTRLTPANSTLFMKQTR
jgi:cytoskeleton protein RodZ